MTIRVVVEFQARPGRREELEGVLESIVAKEAPNLPGFLGSARYEVLDNPDALIEIAEWESVESRAAHMEEAAASGTYAQLPEMLAVPVRATVVRLLP
jgi:quinol monooxygenase YgiN